MIAVAYPSTGRFRTRSGSESRRGCFVRRETASDGSGVGRGTLGQPEHSHQGLHELEREGVLTTEQGTGTFVATPSPARIPEAQRKEKLESLCLEFLAHASAHGFTHREVLQTLDAITERK